MPRDIPVGNGVLLVTFDSKYQIRDFYFPHPGRENQSSGRPFRLGVWVDGQFSWVSSDDWSRDLNYQEETLVTQVRLRCARLGVELIVNDTVDFYENVFLRRVEVVNLVEGKSREIRVFFHHDFHISETPIGDTAFYDPDPAVIIHYKRNRYFLIGCRHDGKDAFDQWATGAKELNGAEGTWRDAEDGILGCNPIAQGSVDSVVSVHVVVEGNGRKAFTYWIAAGRDYKEVKAINEVVCAKSVEGLILRTAEYWRAWVNKESLNYDTLPEKVIRAYKRSLLVIRTNTDDNGAILAANDSDVETYNGDTYSYVWPRDGALTAYSMDISGFAEVTRRFYGFMKTLLTREGYFLHKYTPDGTVGSSWHPWIADGVPQLPIQEDETALILWGLWKHYNEHRDLEFIAEFYSSVIKRAADFMVSYRDPETKLPLGSWDLWEEVHGVHTFTVSTVWAGLQAAARFADLFGESDLADKYSGVADEIKQGAITHLYLPDLGRFAKSLILPPSGGKGGDPPPKPKYNTTVDASLFGVWYFGMLEASDPMVESTIKAIRDSLWVHTDVGGIARYQNDTYHQVSRDVAKVPGNPWFVCTLWLADYEIWLAKSPEDLKPALALIEWAVDHALPSGVLAEQVNPYSDVPLSVSPLTWSHAQLVTVVMAYLHRTREMQSCGNCGQPAFDYVRQNTGVLPACIEAFRSGE
jgi:glucoamylase